MQSIQKILVIDSDSICFIIIKHLFSNKGILPVFEHTKNAEDALSYLNKNEIPDLIFLEPVLPDMMEDEIFEALHNLNIFERTLVCILTTYFEHELEKLGSDYKILNKFSKPFHKRHVATLLDDLKVA